MRSTLYDLIQTQTISPGTMHPPGLSAHAFAVSMNRSAAHRTAAGPRASHDEMGAARSKLKHFNLKSDDVSFSSHELAELDLALTSLCGRSLDGSAGEIETLWSNIYNACERNDQKKQFMACLTLIDLGVLDVGHTRSDGRTLVEMALGKTTSETSATGTGATSKPGSQARQDNVISFRERAHALFLRGAEVDLADRVNLPNPGDEIIRAFHGKLGLHEDHSSFVVTLPQLGDRKALANYKADLKAGKFWLDPQHDQTRSVLGELLTYLVDSGRPYFAEEQDNRSEKLFQAYVPAPGGFNEKGSGPVEDHERVLLLADANPTYGFCNHLLEPPVWFALRNEMKYVTGLYADSNNTEVRRYMEGPLSPQHIDATMTDFLMPQTFDFSTGGAGYEHANRLPLSACWEFVIGVMHLDWLMPSSTSREHGSLDLDEVLKTALKIFVEISAGEHLPENLSADDKNIIRVSSHLNCIWIRLNHGFDVQPFDEAQHQELLKQSLWDAHRFVVETQPTQGPTDDIYRLILEHWEFFSETEQKQIVPQVLQLLRSGSSSVLGAGFHQAIFVPLVVRGTDAQLKESVVEALEIELNRYLPPDMSRVKGPAFAYKARIEEWKTSQAPDKLQSILNGLQQAVRNGHSIGWAALYFDLFLHCKNDDQQEQITRALMLVQSREGFELMGIGHRPNLMGMGHRPKHSTATCWANFALASMNAHYMLSKPEATYGESAAWSVGWPTGFSRPGPVKTIHILEKIRRQLGEGIRYLSEQFSYGTESEQAFNIQLAQEQISLLAKLASKQSVETLSIGDEQIAREITEWAFNARKMLNELDTPLKEYAHNALARSEEPEEITDLTLVAPPAERT